MKQKNDQMTHAARSRLKAVNELVRCIGDNGRRFFYSKEHDRYARMDVVVGGNGRLCWVDEWTGKRIYLHYKYWGKGFSNGGTLKDLVNQMKRFVLTGQMLPEKTFGPWPDWYCNGDLWGYGESMQIIRAKAAELGLIPKSVVELEKLQSGMTRLQDALARVLIEFPPVGPSCGCDESGACVWHRAYSLVPELYHQKAAALGEEGV